MVYGQLSHFLRFEALEGSQAIASLTVAVGFLATVVATVDPTRTYSPLTSSNHTASTAISIDHALQTPTRTATAIVYPHAD